MVIGRLLAGLALLVVGRSLFWLVVAALGFAAGLTLTLRALPNQPEIIVLIIAVVVGILGAGLAIAVQRIAAGLAGALAGGILLMGLADLIGIDAGAFVWALFVIGAVIGAIAVSLLFDWALVVLTSAAGAVLVAQSFELAPGLRLLVFAIALAVGVLIQSRSLRRGAT